MGKNLQIEVSPNLRKCLEVLKEAIENLPPSELKTKAEGAILYIVRTFEGEAQPGGGDFCPQGIPFIPG